MGIGESVPLVQKEAMELAVKNIANFGDTDIFPFPIENRLFHDLPQAVVDVLRSIDGDFEAHLTKMPVLTSKELTT